MIYKYIGSLFVKQIPNPIYLLVKLMKVKDKRFNALKTYIDSGEIKAFSEIFEIVPKAVFVNETGINFVRLTEKIKNPEKFTVKEILVYAQLINVDSRKLYDLIIKTLEKKPSTKK
ncbi:hypothetical protein [Terrimonas alba]|uniref:hypothetical protein n=1 Tax=Terrimonas alba TaxID=3349636 RepID=UPI0035F3CB66